MTLRIGIIANSAEALQLDRAGGFVHVVETAKRWDDVELVVMGPRAAESAFRRHLDLHDYIGIPDWGAEMSARSMLGRSVASLRYLRELRQKCDVVMAMSHSIPDSLPAMLFGRKHSAVQYWHFIGNPFKRPGSVLRNLLAYGNERLGKAFALRCRGKIIGNPALARAMGLIGEPFAHVTTNGVASAHEPSLVRSGAVYVGRLHPAKGVDDLIDIWARVHLERPGEHLTLVGTGAPAYVSGLNAEIQSRGLNDVITIREDVDDAEKWRLLSRSRLFAFASHEEGWGIAIAEAMSVGLPCVTYELPPFKDIFPFGRVSCDVGDREAFARLTLSLLGDPAYYDEVSKGARALGGSYTWERAAEIELRALREIAG